MIVESISIFIIFAVMIFLFMRANKKSYAAATAPLLAVPVFQIIANILNELISVNVSIEMKTLILIIGLSVSLVLIGGVSILLTGKRSRIIYIIISGGFSTILTVIFMYNNFISSSL